MSAIDEIREEADPREYRNLRAQLAKKQADYRDLQKKLDLVTSIDEAKLKIPSWLSPKASANGHRGTVCMMLTDTHFGEKVNPAEIDFLNAYDDDIAEKRLRKFYEKGTRLARDYVSGINYDGCALFWGGDIFTGTIHEELVETNTETLYASVIRFIEPLVALCYALADEFGHLHNAVTFGNHGRRTRKPRAKQRAQDNIEWLLYKVLERETRHDKRITWQIPDSADTNVEIYNTKFLLTHGDQFRGGSGIAGALSPLLLGTHRKTKRAMASGRLFDIIVMGHFHQYISLPGLIVGGTLKGMDEYAYLGNFGYEVPQQAFWITAPERPIVLSGSIDVMDRTKEGW